MSNTAFDIIYCNNSLFQQNINFQQSLSLKIQHHETSGNLQGN